MAEKKVTEIGNRCAWRVYLEGVSACKRLGERIQIKSRDCSRILQRNVLFYL